MAKTIDQHFADWESEVFGLGYGTGEYYVIPALKTFFYAVSRKRPYDYQIIEGILTPPVAWLLINTLGNEDLIEYGSSPRFGWHTKTGDALAEYFNSKTVEELLEATDVETNYCTRKYCNCDDAPCVSPFWQNHPDRRFLNG